MAFEPGTYSESSIILENIIVEVHHEFILQNRYKTAGESGQKRVLRGSLPVVQKELVTGYRDLGRK